METLAHRPLRVILALGSWYVPSWTLFFVTEKHVNLSQW